MGSIEILGQQGCCCCVFRSLADAYRQRCGDQDQIHPALLSGHLGEVLDIAGIHLGTEVVKV